MYVCYYANLEMVSFPFSSFPFKNNFLVQLQVHLKQMLAHHSTLKARMVFCSSCANKSVNCGQDDTQAAIMTQPTRLAPFSPYL